MPRYLEQRMVSHGRVLGHHCHLLVFWQWNPEHHDHRDAGTIDLGTAWRRDARDPRRLPAKATPLPLAAPRRKKPRMISVTLDEGKSRATKRLRLRSGAPAIRPDPA